MSHSALTNFKRFISSVTAVAVLSGVLTVPSILHSDSAQAAEQNSGSVTQAAKADTNSPPSGISLSSKENDDGTITLISSTANPIEDSNSVVELYRVGQTTPVDSKNSGKDFSFSINRPVDGYEQYYVQTGQIRSNLIVINSLNNNWNVDLTLDKGVFSTDDDTPVLTWKTKNSIRDTNYLIYVVDITDNKVIYDSRYQSPSDTGTLPISRIYKGESHQYQAYVAERTPQSVSDVTSIENIQSISSSVSVERTPWSIDISIDKQEVSTDDESPILTWNANQSINKTNGEYLIYVVDKTDNKIIYDTRTAYNSSKTGTVYLPKFYNGASHVYQAYVAARTASFTSDPSELKEIQAESATKDISSKAWSIDISIDKAQFSTDDDTPILTWNTNQSINRTNGEYLIYVVDTTDSKIVYDSRTAYNSYQTGSITLPRIYSGDAHEYQAYVAARTSSFTSETNELKDIKAISNTVQTKRSEWAVSIGINRNTFSTDDETPVVTWNTNQSINRTNGEYLLYLVDVAEHKIVYDTRSAYNSYNSDVITLPRMYTGGPHNYQAYIAARTPTFTDDFNQLKDIQAVSGLVVTQRSTWNISLDSKVIDYNVNSDFPSASTKTIAINWNTNQSINRTNNEYLVYIVNTTTNKIVYDTRTAYNSYKQDTISFTADLDSDDAYIAYVAARMYPFTGDTSDLKDIQAVSNITNPNLASGSVDPDELKNGSNPSEGNCNQQCYADPISSINGEYFENSEDISLSSAIPLSFSRSYSASSIEKDSSLGYGWNNNFDMAIVNSSKSSSSLDNSSQVSIEQENGSVVTFYRNTDGTYFAANRVLASLKLNDDKARFILSRTTGFSFEFDIESGKLLSVKDDNGNKITIEYNSGKISKAYSNTGQYLTFVWSNNRIASVKDNAQREVKYSYDNEGNLVQVDIPEASNPLKYEYSSKHLISSITSLTGGVTTNAYDSQNRVVSQKDALDNETKFSYSADRITGKKTTTITSPDGTVTKDYYSVDNQLVKQTEAYGTNDEASSSYVYGTTGQTISITNGEGNTTNYAYDSNGNVISVIDPMGRETNLEYNSQNKVTKITDAEGNSASNTYDNKGNLTEAKDFKGNPTQYTYNSFGLPVTVKMPNEVLSGSNKVTTYSYTTSGYLEKITSPNGGAMSYKLDALGNAIESTDPNGNVTKYTFDDRYRPSKVTYPNSSESSVVYKASGLRLKTTDIKGNETAYTYDANGNILTVTQPLGTNSYVYDKQGNVVSITDFGGRKISIEYDNRGNTIKTIDPKGNSVSNKWLKNNLLLSTTRDSNSATTKYAYDANGNLVSTTSPMGKVTSARYDKLGRVINSTSPTDLVQTYSYDANGQLLKTIRADGTSVSQEYDANGQVTKYTDASGASTTNSYDAEGNVLTSTDKAGVSTEYTYDAMGNPATSKDKKQVVTSYKYDSMNQISATSYDNWSTIDTQYEYNNYEELVSVKKGTSEVNYTYNQLGDITRRGPPTGNGVSYSYNDLGQLNTLTYPDNTKVGYKYDANGNTTKVYLNDSKIADYSYDDIDSITSTVYGNNVTEKNEYDLDAQLTSNIVTNSSDEILSSQKVTLDKAGFITQSDTSLSDSSGAKKQSTNKYTYDDLKRLASSTKDTEPTKNYGFDNQSNLLDSDRGTATYNVLGQLHSLTKANTVKTFGYDANGNRSSQKVSTTNDGNVTEENIGYSYNKEDQLTQVKLGDSKTVDYSYDATGLLSNRTKTVDGETSEKNFVWDTSTSISSLISDGKFDYIYGNQQAPIAQVNKDTGKIYYLNTDQKGSVSLLTNESGDVKASYEYDDYGNLTNSEDNPSHSYTAFGYAGEYQDSDTSNYLMGARWYDPAGASFLTEDPIASSTDEPYSYASGNPVMASDPSGYSSFWNNAAQFGLGALDGLTGGISTMALDAFAPGVIDHCSSAFAWGTAAGTIASFLTPGGGLVHLAGLAVHLGASVHIISVLAHAGSSLHTSGSIISSASMLGAGGLGKAKKAYDAVDWLKKAKAGKIEYRGGIYGDIHKMTEGHRKEFALEIHHMPMQAAWKYGKMDGPSVLVRASDHAMTMTFRGRANGLKIGDRALSVPFLIRRDVRDLLNTPGGKQGLYDDGIREMLAHPNAAQHKVDPKEFGL
jgi:RHS repeat-associated protein